MKRFDPLTYRYPRSLGEAFPDDPQYANAFEGHINIGAGPNPDRVVVVACAIAAVAVAVLAVLRALPGGAA